MMYWIEFIISSVFIIIAGIRLTRYADFLSDKSNIEKAWIGVILLGVVTSLPEAVASFVSIRVLLANDLAVGNILGSNIFNPLLIVVMDLSYREGSITNIIRSKRSHKYSAHFAIILVVIVLCDLIFRLPSVGPVSVGTALIILVYLGAVRYLGNMESVEQQKREVNMSYQKIWINIVVSATVVVISAVWLAKSCDVIALETGLGRTFVGTLFLAVVTSLPEMVVVVSALKIGAVDLAIGNLFGSNMINIFILAVCGLFSQSGPLLYMASSTHIFTAILGIILTYLAWVGSQSENKKTFLGLGLDSIIMVLIFTIGMYVLYLLR